MRDPHDDLRGDLDTLSDAAFTAKYAKWTHLGWTKLDAPLTKAVAEEWICPMAERTPEARFARDLALFCAAEDRRLVEYRAGRPVTRLNRSVS